MNVLIINLTRFGDLLQMQPLILELKAAGHKIGLLCLGNFAEATMLLRGVDFVAPLGGGDILRHVEQDWHKALSQMESLFSQIAQNFPVDSVLNTTATISSRILARRIIQDAQRQKMASSGLLAEQIDIPFLGFGLDDHGFGQSGNMWATFLQGASAERLNCPFNIVDMFRAVASPKPLPARPTPRGLQKVPTQLQQAAQAFLQEEFQQLSLSIAQKEHFQGYVALQLGASESRRQWALEHFATVAEKLWQEKGLCPVLLGSPAEKPLGLSYAEKSVELMGHTSAAHAHGTPSPHINAIGKTNIPHLAAVLQECALLITNDTGTMHLAAGLDVPVLSIFLATAQAFDTGPYVPNACCLEPALPCHPCAFHSPCVHQMPSHIEGHTTDTPQPCLTSISANTVGHLALHFLEHGTWHCPPQSEARIWITEEDATGFAALRCISGHEKEERSHWLAIQRYFYRHILDEISTYPPLAQEHVQALSLELRQEVSQVLHHSTELLLLLTEQLLILQKVPMPNQGQRILGTCNTIHQVLAKCNHLKALSYLWIVLFQERGGDIESFSHLVHSLRAHLVQWHNALK